MRFIMILFLLFVNQYVFCQIRIFTDFENGNGELISSDIKQNKLTIRPELKNNQNTTRCWFYFGFTGFDIGRDVEIEYQYDSYVIAAEYPVYSYDQYTWYRLHSDVSRLWTKRVKHKFESDTVYFATGYPYTYSDVINYVNSIASSNYVDTATLCYSEIGLPIPMFTIREPNEEPTELVWIIGRQHAFETTLNYVLEGIVNFLLSDNREAKKSLKNTVFYIVPMVDVDNVFIGGSGRMQKPIDFNRCWSNEPYWNAVRKIQELMKETVKLYNYRLFLDFHSTYPGGKQTYFGVFNDYKNSDPEYKKIKRFLNIYYRNSNYYLDEIHGDTFDYYAETYSAGLVDSNVKALDFSTTIECDWTINHNGKPFVISELYDVGRLFAKTICMYLLKQK